MKIRKWKEGTMNKVETVNHGILEEERNGVFLDCKNRTVYFTVPFSSEDLSNGLDSNYFTEEIEVVNERDDDGELVSTSVYAVVQIVSFNELKELTAKL